jgi:CheY-like chemotaxis protein
VISLLIADDHPVVRNGLRGIFTGDPEFEVLGEASSGVEAVALAVARRPQVVLMDLRMPGGDGVTAIRELPTARPPPSCSSPRRRSRRTCCTSTRSSGSTTGRPPWRPATSAACSAPGRFPA